MNGELIASFTQNLATATPEVLNATTEIVKASTKHTPYLIIAVAACIIVGAAVCAIVQGRVIEKVSDYNIIVVNTPEELIKTLLYNDNLVTTC